jgi:hypothetical protein
MNEVDRISNKSDAAVTIKQLRNAALSDEDGNKLRALLSA